MTNRRRLMALGAVLLSVLGLAIWQSAVGAAGLSVPQMTTAAGGPVAEQISLSAPGAAQVQWLPSQPSAAYDQRLVVGVCLGSQSRAYVLTGVQHEMLLSDRDRQGATIVAWSPDRGQLVVSRRNTRGSLKRLPYSVCTWSEWLHAHPDSKLGQPQFAAPAS